MKTLETPSTLPTVASTSSFVHIGESSYSPGDLYLECLLPKVITKNCHDELAPQHIAYKQKLKPKVKNRFDLHNEDNQGVQVLPLADHPAVRRGQAECLSVLNGNDIAILEDEDVKEDVVQILGSEAELVFPAHNIFRYLVMFVKNLDEFLEFYVEILDGKQKYRMFKVTNARSLAQVEQSTCQLPLEFGSKPGWRYLCMDLQDLTRQAFGTKHITTTQLRIGGNCRLLRVFFQDERYSDAELPPHLTFLG